METLAISGYLVLAWQRGSSAWGGGSWRIDAYWPELPEHLPWVAHPEAGGRAGALLKRDETALVWVTGPVTISLIAAEAEGIWLNVTAPQPRLFALLRCDEGESWPTPRVVTVSQHEAARWMDGGEWVEACPLPTFLRDPLLEFALWHYRPERKQKVRRNDPLGVLGRKTDAG